MASVGSPSIAHSQPVVLITGGNGLLAPFMEEAGRKYGEVILTARQGGNFSCDLADGTSVKYLLEKTKPEVVIHCAAMTDVDKCEKNAAEAYDGNLNTTKNIVRYFPRKCQLVYISTDQVYPDISGPHQEGSEDPVNEYGRSKLAGEQAALASPGSLVLRTSFFGTSRTPNRKSLSDFVVDSLSARKQISLFPDVLFSPLHATTVATLTFEMIERRLNGVFNLASRDGLSKAEFALTVASHFGLQTETATEGYSTMQPGRAIRPKDLRMDPSQLERALGMTMPGLKQEIEKI
jgi:dTDP-4-dehydrorhamnose reductase